MAKRMSFKEALEVFRAIQGEHAEVGATDTEVREIFYQLAQQAAIGVRKAIPSSSTGWGLYGPQYRAVAAARALYAAAHDAIDAGFRDPAGLQHYLDNPWED